MGRPEGNNTIAIGATIMGLSLVAGFICTMMFFGSYYYDTGVGLAFAVLFCWLSFFAGFVVLVIGLVIKLIHLGNNEKVESKPVNINVKETTSTEKKAQPIDTTGMVTCPYCGREQAKNSFGCIYCHEKF